MSKTLVGFDFRSEA